MIDILTDNSPTVRATVGGEMNIADFRELEDALRHGVRFQGKINLIIDLRDMLGYSLDVAWEDLRFTHAWSQDFGRIAIVTGNQWIAWSALFYRLFSDTEIRIFDNNAEAEDWIAETAA